MSLRIRNANLTFLRLPRPTLYACMTGVLACTVWPGGGASAQVASSKSSLPAAAPTANAAPQTSPKDPAAAKPSVHEEEASSKSTDPGQQRLKVHGHWTITVKNADGTPVSHEEFDNNLGESGSNNLILLLSGGAVVNGYDLNLGSPGGTTPCGSSQSCVILAATDPSGPGPAGARCGGIYAGYIVCFSGLAITNPVVSGYEALQLSGQLQATQAGTFSTVSSELWLCGSAFTPLSSTSPASCATQSESSFSTGGTFTYTSSSTNPAFTPVSVSSGQIVQVTVVIYFPTS